MKNKLKKSKSVVKGAPSGFVISLMVHAVAFMLAGVLVVEERESDGRRKWSLPCAN